ncbi:MAG: T9SS type A sorting domain-containing protein, partial [Candidatus Cloacimonadaceae bacterium]|nr:T9SS type A sorting domain-containing protein [Candidatus Cloacimonadaceae bacterium]
DVNGDGYADYVLQSGVPGGDNFNVRIALYYGGPNFPQVDSLVISDNTYQVLGSRGGCPLGDLNNDGYNDFTAYNGRIWYGGSEITSVNDLTINYYTQQHQWSSLTYQNGYEMEFIYGDLNGDSYDDAIASNAYIGFYNGEVGIWLGGPNMNGNCKLYLEPPADYESRNYGWSRAMGDFNGDGLCDLAVSAPYWGQQQTGFLTEGRVYVYSGNTELVGNEDDVLPPLSESSKWEIQLFPNPISGDGASLNIKFLGQGYKELKSAKMEIFNIKGQKISSYIADQVSLSSGSYTGQMPDLVPGLYFLKVSDQTQGIRTHKFIVK